jgi:hypothetical protein
LDFLFFGPIAEDAFVKAEEAFASERLGRRYDSLEFWRSGNYCQIQYARELKGTLNPYRIINKIYKTNFDLLILQHIVGR